MPLKELLELIHHKAKTDSVFDKEKNQPSDFKYTKNLLPPVREAIKTNITNTPELKELPPRYKQCLLALTAELLDIEIVVLLLEHLNMPNFDEEKITEEQIAINTFRTHWKRPINSNGLPFIPETVTDNDLLALLQLTHLEHTLTRLGSLECVDNYTLLTAPQQQAIASRALAIIELILQRKLLTGKQKVNITSKANNTNMHPNFTTLCEQHLNLPKKGHVKTSTLYVSTPSSNAMPSTTTSSTCLVATVMPERQGIAVSPPVAVAAPALPSVIDRPRDTRTQDIPAAIQAAPSSPAQPPARQTPNPEQNASLIINRLKICLCDSGWAILHIPSRDTFAQLEQHQLTPTQALEKLNKDIESDYQATQQQYDGLERAYRDCFSVREPSPGQLQKIRDVIQLKTDILQKNLYLQQIEQYVLLLGILKTALDEAQQRHLNSGIKAIKFFTQSELVNVLTRSLAAAAPSIIDKGIFSDTIQTDSPILILARQIYEKWADNGDAPTLAAQSHNKK